MREKDVCLQLGSWRCRRGRRKNWTQAIRRGRRENWHCHQSVVNAAEDTQKPGCTRRVKTSAVYISPFLASVQVVVFVCRDLDVNAKVTFFLLSLLTETPSTLPSQQWQSTNLSGDCGHFQQRYLTALPEYLSWHLCAALAPPKVVTEKLTVTSNVPVLNWSGYDYMEGGKRLRLKEKEKRRSRRALQ